MSIYEHFRREEHPFVDQVLEWKRTVTEQYRPRLTDFLDPRQRTIVRSLIGKQEDVNCDFNGGAEQAERKRCLLFPAYFVPERSDFETAVFEMQYPSKFVKLEHRNILGALMNIGLKREKFGDILSDGSRFQVIVAEEVADFVQWNLTSVGKANVSLHHVSDEKDVLHVESDTLLQQVTVSSLRLDAIVAEAHHLSRSKAKPLIESGLVKVNWKVISDPGFQLQESDVISVRGKGRCELKSNEGNTKKGKWRITLGFPK
ncbi:RNA-binding protein YlmH, contains S4-like domain [Evansella caseinilytica]|uniref:RNA-binding protein YlmH, contains S4-like domain n=1 Tax=Evansella caseinilytica TaxID=1503961 RepID=A0A1H3MFJ2_9BACI|nr:RNA-binding protein [Evansella caseinilytica]SDY75416.1 RNA-binding protein YlmH, contains S4-like domain [Evansella caseinilytica]